MGDAAEDRAKAQDLPEGDVVRILLEQHAQVRDLFARIQAAPAADRKEPFDELRALLAVHETGEELVLRPEADDDAWKGVAHERNQEERGANQVLADLEHLDPATEAEVLDSLRRLALGRTVILASHAAAAHAFSGRRLDIRAGKAVSARGAA